MKILQILVLTFVTMAATSTISYAQTTSQSQEIDNIKTITVKVKGVGCGQDIKSIVGNVEKLEGVTSCKTLKKGAVTSFEIKMNPAITTEEAINAAIENTAGCRNPNDRPYKVKQ